MDRGETLRLVLCGTSIPARYRLALPPGIRLVYEQRLRHCGIGDQRPGLQLVLEADGAAVSGALTVSDADQGTAACDAVPVTIPERRLLPAATLTFDGSRSGRAMLLTVEAPKGADFSPGCQARLEFPQTAGLSLARDPDAGATRCSTRRLRLPVQALDSRQSPAKILVPAVRWADGSSTEAVAYAEPPPPPWLRDMAEPDAKFIQADGVRTRYFDQGTGEALLLVHGGQPSSMDGTAWDWQQNFAELAKHFHVYALDRIGQGYTDNPASLDDYRDYYPRVVQHLLAFMDAAGIRRAHLVGHSQGSWPVTRIALDHPERVASLTLVDGTMVSPPRDGGSALRFYLYLSQDLHPATGETLESVRRGMEFFSFTHNNLTDQRLGRILAMARQPKVAASQAWFATSGMSPAHPAFRKLKQEILVDLAAGKLRVPVLVVWGQNDPEGSLPSGLEMFRLVSASSPRARMHIFGDSGHLSFVEHPGEFDRLLVDFALGPR